MNIALRIANIDESRVYPRLYFQRHLSKYHQFGDDLWQRRVLEFDLQKNRSYVMLLCDNNLFWHSIPSKFATPKA